MMMKDIAVIFDFDGVIVDSEPAWRKYECPLLIEIFKGFTEDDYHLVRGKSLSDAYDLLATMWPAQAPKDVFLDRIMERIPSIYEESPLFTGMMDILKSLKDKNVPTALATSSRISWVEPLLQSHGIRNFFTAIATADDVQKAKPAPDIFLKAAEKLGIEPSRCIVIEDAQNGVIAAKAAGMKTIGYIVEEGRRIDPEPDVVIHHFDQFFDAFEKLLLANR